MIQLMNLGSKKSGTLKVARPLRERLRETTREAIFAAAESIFAAKGLHAARVEDVAAAAGVSVGTLYNYFGDRNGLLDALIQAHRAEFLSRIDAVLDAREAPSSATASASHRRGEARSFRSTLESFIGEYLRHVEAHRQFFAVLLEEELERGRGPDPAARKTIMRELARRADRLVRAGVAEGVLRAEDVDLYAPLLLGMLRGVFISTMYWREAPPFDALSPAMVRLFLEGAEAKKR